MWGGACRCVCGGVHVGVCVGGVHVGVCVCGGACWCVGGVHVGVCVGGACRCVWGVGGCM